jgi:hypothetical protein
VRQWLPAWLYRFLFAADALAYRMALAAVMPINQLLARTLARRVRPGSVLHVSGMVHVAYYTTRILREQGVDADYLAVGTSPWWDRADYAVRPSRFWLFAVLQEMWWVWRVVSRYEIIHAHFIVTVSRSGWEWPLLRRMGRHIVVHYRGCEIRNRELNMRLHPEINICSECDYHPRLCATPVNARRRELAARFGSEFLVTTPDLKDFAPGAVHIPFFVTRTDLGAQEPAGRPSARPFKIVHATNHRGIEGSARIREAVEKVGQTIPINYVELTGVTHERVLAELADADLSIGKMKMGYYANLQIEAMMAGVPTITWVRPEFVTGALRDSGFIFATLDSLAEVLTFYLTHPEELAARRRRARESILRLHDNAAIAAQYRDMYQRLRETTPTHG